MIIASIVVILFLGYTALLFYYLNGWNSLPSFDASKAWSDIKVTVVIAARNEELNIRSLLQALQRQTYPKDHLEVIVVDDHSEDRTAEIVKQFPGTILLQLNDEAINSYKKKAIALGVSNASGELIVTTDYDCQPADEWLATIVAFRKETASPFIVAPVAIEENNNKLSLFQSMDFMILQGITAAAVHRNVHSMCNGANLAYDRQAFIAVNGFEGIDNIASGDDMLLMHKMKSAFPGQMGYLKSEKAIVRTKPVSTWRSFFNQRIRWASKASHYQDKSMFWVLLLVYLFNLAFLLLFIAGFWHPYYWVFLMLLLLAKTFSELPFFNAVKKFYNKQWSGIQFFMFQPLHIAYIILSGLLGQLGAYEWKGRKVK